MRTTNDIYEKLAYAPEVGGSCLVWKVSPRYGINVGDRAGTLMRNGRWNVFVGGKGYLAHRIVWALCTGHWPECDLDHIDRNPSNNILTNLRLCPNNNADNMQNKRTYCNNRTGYTGVYKIGEKFKAQIQIAKVLRYIGVFDTPEAAYAAYLEAKAKLHPFSSQSAIGGSM